MPSTRSQSKEKPVQAKLTGQIDTGKNRKSTMDVYLKSKQGAASTSVSESTKRTEEQSRIQIPEGSEIIGDTQSVLSKILLAVQPIDDMNRKLDNLVIDMGVLKKQSKTKVEQLRVPLKTWKFKKNLQRSVKQGWIIMKKKLSIRNNLQC